MPRECVIALLGLSFHTLIQNMLIFCGEAFHFHLLAFWSYSNIPKTSKYIWRGFHSSVLGKVHPNQYLPATNSKKLSRGFHSWLEAVISNTAVKQLHFIFGMQHYRWHEDPIVSQKNLSIQKGFYMYLACMKGCNVPPSYFLSFLRTVFLRDLSLRRKTLTDGNRVFWWSEKYVLKT